MDEKEILEKSAKAKAARSEWAADMVSRVVAAGQSIIGKREQVRTASAPERTSPFSNNQPQVGARLDVGAAQGGPRDIKSIAAMDKDRQINQVVDKARALVAKKLSDMPVNGHNITYLKADISRWDDHSGQPQTGRISFQIPFHGPHGDPRTIYASVDLVMGGLMEPKTFTDGMNNVYALDSSGIKEMFKGQEFEVVHQPKVVPEIKYTSPDFHAPDGQGGAVAAVNSPLIFKKASGDMTRSASGEKPRIAREGSVRALSKEAFDIAQPITPEQAKNPKGAPAKREPSSAIPKFPGGSESNTGYVGEGPNSGGGQTPAAITVAAVTARAELRELNWDGTVRAVAKNDDVKQLLELAHAVTYGGHDYVVEVWNDGELVERIASVKTNRANAGMRFATALRLGGKSKHDPKKKAYDQVGAIMAFEDGSLDDEGVLELFQHLVDTGLAWSLQGSYGRAAASLLEQGLIRPANSDKQDAYGNTVPGKPRDDEGMEPEASARGTVRTASLSKVVKDLNLLDVRMLSFRDLAMLCKQHGQESSLTFDSAASELAKAGIVLFRTASGKADNILPYRLAHARRTLIAAPPPGAAAADLATSPTGDNGQPSDPPAPGATATPGMGGGEGKSEIAPPSGLDPVAFREFQALLDQYNNVWETTHQRELNNIKNGNPPHMGIDYTDLQLLYDKIEAFQQQAQSEKSDELSSTPADLANADKTSPATGGIQAPAPNQPEGGSTTLMPEKGHGLAGLAPKMTRAAIEQAMDMKEQALTVTDGAETVAANTANIDAAKGGGTSLPKTAMYDLDEEAKTQMVTMGKDPTNPEDIKEFMGTFKKVSSHSQKFPDVCKNCKNLVVPNGYSALKEYKHTRLPFCGAAKEPGVGFLAAYFRDCVSYDPIIKDIPQKVEMKSTESEQTEKDSEKGRKPIMERAGANEQHRKEIEGSICDKCHDAAKLHSYKHDMYLCAKHAAEMGVKLGDEGVKTAAALPSADPKAVREKDSQTGAGLDIRQWCEKAGHYAPAGESHPTHDWCTLWNTAVDNLVMLPSGAVIPKSMSGQSSETHGEGGPHQFGNTPNQVI